MQIDSVAAGDFQRPQHVGVPEPGGVNDDIGIAGHAVFGDDAVSCDPPDRCAHQFDVVPLQCPQPAAVVLQCPFAGGRVVGQDLRQQLVAFADLAGDPVGKHHSGGGVDVADGVVLIGVIRVAARGVESLVGAGP